MLSLLQAGLATIPRFNPNSMPKITLLCPSFERHFYLERSMRFWGTKNVNVIYLDGSKKPFIGNNLGFENISYLHHPVGYDERILASINYIKTPYVAMICDDEFYVPSALNSCVEFLESNPEYVSASGSAIAFSSSGNVVRLNPVYSALAARHLSQDTPVSRLTSHFSSYVQSHYYGVTKTDLFIKSISLALRRTPDVFAIFELAHEFIVAASGKTIVLENLYWLRSSEAAPIRNTGERSLSPSKRFDVWWLSKDPAFSAERAQFCSMLAAATSNVMTTKEVVNVFNCYVNSRYSNKSSLTKNKFAFMKSLAKKIVPISIVDLFYVLSSSLYRLTTRFRDPVSQNTSTLQALRSQGIRVDDEGLADCLASIEACWKV